MRFLYIAYSDGFTGKVRQFFMNRLRDGRDFVDSKDSWLYKKIVGYLNGDFLDLMYVILVITAIVGFYFSMSGNKKIGTKISSISILAFVLVKVVVSSYA